MKLIFGGVRGTNPVAHADFLKFGGETTAALIEGRGGEKIIIDAGTGLRALSAKLGAGVPGAEVLLLMTHYHLDHLMGLPACGLLYDKAWNIEFAAPRREALKPGEVVRRILAKPFWPIQLDKLQARLRFTTLPSTPTAVRRYGGLEIRWCAVHHPEGCHAYRVDEPATGTALVFATDIEWRLSSDEEKRLFLALCHRPRPAQLLVMDGQFNRTNIATFKGWGHSAWEDDLEVAQIAGVHELLITHHAPQNTDAQLMEIEKAARRIWSGAALARSGMEIEPHG
ncbi:MAG: MBL fold metallo-hydrolase [Verrucomicrobia bacterium]|nr:MAG: MBL fold metallo-hydrolase [Verrucomicrobiota bacterium]